MKENLLEKALEYLFKGWSVIPVGANKIPLISWKEFQTRKATVDEVVAWWTKMPEAQIGIVTGKVSNLTVIDFEADADFDLIKDETYRVKTGGGGVHVYYEFVQDFKNAVKVFPSVDIRSEGGYVIAAGSESSKGSYTALNTLKPTLMCPETKKLFTGPNLKPERVLPWYANSGQQDLLKTPTEGLVYDGAGKGGRNDAMTKFAGSIMAKLHPSLWSSIGWPMFEQANQKNNPPLPAYEIANTWKSIEQRESTQNPGGRNYSASVSSSKTWGPEPEKNKDTVITPEGKNANPETGEIVEDSSETLHVSEIAKMQIIDSEHTYPIDMLPFDDALLGGFTAGDLVVVAGQSGHGKTTIIQDWSVTLSTGGKTGLEKLPSLWFSYEVLAKPLWEKFKLMGAQEDTPIYMPKFNDSGDMEWIVNVVEKAISKWNIRVVCIDHLGFLRAPKGNYSNASDAITHTVRALKKLAIKHGLIILLPVHVRKTNSKIPDLNDIRDSLGIAQEADTVFFIAREKDDFGVNNSQAKVWLVKNRKTGISVNATLDFQFGRYFYDASTNSKPDPEKETIETLKSFGEWTNK